MERTHGNMAANVAVIGVAGGVTCTVWRLLRQDRKLKALEMALDIVKRENRGLSTRLQDLVQQEVDDNNSIAVLKEQLADKDMHLRSAYQAQQAAKAKLHGRVSAHEVEQRVERAVQTRLASIEEDRASTNIALDQALQEARAEKELRQKVEQAQTEALEAAEGQEARIQALQQELSQAAANVNEVPAMETQLAAVRSRLETALEDLQAEKELRQKVEQAQTEALEAAEGQEACIQELQQELSQAAANVNEVSAMETQLAAVRSRLETALEDLQEETALRAKAEADANHAQKAASDQAAAMQSLQDELEAAQAAAQKASLLEHQLAATKAELDTALSNVQAMQQGQVNPFGSPQGTLLPEALDNADIRTSPPESDRDVHVEEGSSGNDAMQAHVTPQVAAGIAADFPPGFHRLPPGLVGAAPQQQPLPALLPPPPGLVGAATEQQPLPALLAPSPGLVRVTPQQQQERQARRRQREYREFWEKHDVWDHNGYIEHVGDSWGDAAPAIAGPVTAPACPSATSRQPARKARMHRNCAHAA